MKDLCSLRAGGEGGFPGTRLRPGRPAGSRVGPRQTGEEQNVRPTSSPPLLRRNPHDSGGP